MSLFLHWFKKYYPYLIVAHCIEGNATICLSNQLLQEYLDVLNRPKFSKFVDFKTNADFLITRLIDISDIYEPIETIDIIKDNPDNRILELAKVSDADFIITGNIKDFDMNFFENTNIISPRDYWEEYKE